MNEIRSEDLKARPSAEAMIEIKDMHKWFGEFHVLRGIDLTVRKRNALWSAVLRAQANQPL